MTVAQEELEAVFPLRPEDPVLGFLLLTSFGQSTYTSLSLIMVIILLPLTSFS